MSKLFGIDIASAVADGFEGELKSATLTRDNPGTYDPVTDTYSGGGADQTFTSEGIVSKYSKKMIQEGLVQSNDREILLLAQPLGTIPDPGEDNAEPDKITIESETFTVVDVDKDPSDSIYIVQGRL